MKTNIGEPRLNGTLVGLAMKEMVRRAMSSIARNRMNFVATEKAGFREEKDFLTTADTEAQEIYLKTIKEAYPTYGIIAEEDSLRVDCTEELCDIYFTIDPLDGTKAFMRRQSHGIGTMISLVCDEEVIGACVGDVMTKEIYYFRPGSEKVHRFSWNDEFHEVLTIKTTGSLSDSYVLLGEDPRKLSKITRLMTDPDRRRKVFKNIEIMGGSIGVKMARLWKGEVGAVILGAGKCTPWDWCPIAGISNRLGFVMVAYIEGQWVSKPLCPIKECEVWENDWIVIHVSRVAELKMSIG